VVVPVTLYVPGAKVALLVETTPLVETTRLGAPVLWVNVTAPVFRLTLN